MGIVCLEWSVVDLAATLYPLPGQQGNSQVPRTNFRGPVSVTEYGLFPIVDRPTVYVDSVGVVIAWYLPGLFSRGVDVSLDPQLPEPCRLTASEGQIYTAAYKASMAKPPLLSIPYKYDGSVDDYPLYLGEGFCSLRRGSFTMAQCWEHPDPTAV